MMKKRLLAMMTSVFLLAATTLPAYAEEVEIRDPNGEAHYKVHNVIAMDAYPVLTNKYGFSATGYICQAPVTIEVLTNRIDLIWVSQQMFVGANQIASSPIGFYEEYGCPPDKLEAGDTVTVYKPGIYSVGASDVELTGTWNTNLIVKGEAQPTASTVYINGKEVAFDAYNIGDNNFFKRSVISRWLSKVRIKNMLLIGMRSTK